MACSRYGQFKGYEPAYGSFNYTYYPIYKLFYHLLVYLELYDFFKLQLLTLSLCEKRTLIEDKPIIIIIIMPFLCV